MSTITTKIAPNASAVLFRRSRRSASLYGPTPAWPSIALSPSAKPGSRAAGLPGLGAVGSTAISSRDALARPKLSSYPLSVLLELPGAPVVQVGRMHHCRTEVDSVAHELRHLLGPVDDHIRLLGHV